jgi:hypothetical protein
MTLLALFLEALEWLMAAFLVYAFGFWSAHKARDLRLRCTLGRHVLVPMTEETRRRIGVGEVQPREKWVLQECSSCSKPFLRDRKREP